MELTMSCLLRIHTILPFCILSLFQSLHILFSNPMSMWHSFLMHNGHIQFHSYGRFHFRSDSMLNQGIWLLTVGVIWSDNIKVCNQGSSNHNQGKIFEFNMLGTCVATSWHQWAPFQIAGLLHAWQISHQISRYVYHEGW